MIQNEKIITKTDANGKGAGSRLVSPRPWRSSQIKISRKFGKSANKGRTQSSWGLQSRCAELARYCIKEWRTSSS